MKVDSNETQTTHSESRPRAGGAPKKFKRATNAATAKKRSNNALRSARKAPSARGNSALLGVPEWVSSSTRNFNLKGEEMARVKNYVMESPLVLGALGVGLGTILGVMLPRTLTRRQAGRANHRRK